MRNTKKNCSHNWSTRITDLSMYHKSQKTEGKTTTNNVATRLLTLCGVDAFPWLWMVTRVNPCDVTYSQKKTSIPWKCLTFFGRFFLLFSKPNAAWAANSNASGTALLTYALAVSTYATADTCFDANRACSAVTGILCACAKYVIVSLSLRASARHPHKMTGALAQWFRISRYHCNGKLILVKCFDVLN